MKMHYTLSLCLIFESQYRRSQNYHPVLAHFDDFTSLGCGRGAENIGRIGIFKFMS